MPRSVKLKYCELLQEIQVESFHEVKPPTKQPAKTSVVYLVIQAFTEFYQINRKKTHRKQKKEVDKAVEIPNEFTLFEKAIESSSSHELEFTEPLSDDMKVWIESLLRWCEDVDNEIVNASLRALQHFTTDPRCAIYLADHSSNLILRLFEETDNNPTLERKRALSMLIEAISSVPPTEDKKYCFDRCEEVLTTEMQMIGDDLIPADILQYTTEPHRWMQYIIHICFQKDLTVSFVFLSDIAKTRGNPDCFKFFTI